MGGFLRPVESGSCPLTVAVLLSTIAFYLPAFFRLPNTFLGYSDHFLVALVKHLFHFALIIPFFFYINQLSELLLWWSRFTVSISHPLLAPSIK